MNANEVLNKIAEIIGLSKDTTEKVETTEVELTEEVFEVEKVEETIETEVELTEEVEKVEETIEPEVELEEMPVEEPQPKEEEPTEISIEEQVANLEERVAALESSLELKNEELKEKDEVIETLSKQNVELSAQPNTEPIPVESTPKKETYADIMMDKVDNLRKLRNQ